MKTNYPIRSKFMVATGQRYQYHEDELYRYEETGTFAQVNTIAAEAVAFLPHRFDAQTA